MNTSLASAMLQFGQRLFVCKGYDNMKSACVSLILGTLLAISGHSTAQAEGLKSPYVIGLKSRQFTPEPSAAAEITSADKNSYKILQFVDGPKLSTLALAGVQSVHYISANTIMAKVADPSVLNKIPGLRWAGTLQSGDKLAGVMAILEEATDDSVFTFVVEAFSGVRPSTVESLITKAGGMVGSHPNFPAHARLVTGNRAVIEKLAQENEISWFVDAPEAVVSGAPFSYCPGPLTPVGPIAEYAIANQGWDGDGRESATIHYHFVNGTADISGTQEQGAVRSALAQWASQAALHFHETPNAGQNASVDISWATGDHGDGYPFDGASGVLAHTFYPTGTNSEPIAGDMHFDDAEAWSLTTNTHLFTVALHELGHALGLAHSSVAGAVMQAYYNGPVTGLHSDDIAAVQSIYSTVTTADIVWQNSNGQVHYWPIQNGQRIDGINISSPVGTEWNLRGVGDVDGDGADDIVWQNSNGQVHYWPIQNGQRIDGINISSPVGTEWNLRGVGDVNGDGTDDIIWQHSNGQVHYWPIQNGQRVDGFNISGLVGTEWTLRGVGDVNGDGTDDIIWQHSNGQVHYWPMQNGQRVDGINISSPVGTEWTLRGVGDVNGDGTDDIIWRHSSGQVHYWSMQNGQRVDGFNISGPVGAEWTLRGVGNLD